MPAKVQCFWVGLWGPRGTLTWWLNPAKKEKRDESYVIVSNPRTTLQEPWKTKNRRFGGHRIDLCYTNHQTSHGLDDGLDALNLERQRSDWQVGQFRIRRELRSFIQNHWLKPKQNQTNIYIIYTWKWWIPKRTVFHNQYSYLKTTIVQFVTSHVNWAIENTITTYTGGTWKSCWLGMWNLFPPSSLAAHWLCEIWAIDEIINLDQFQQIPPTQNHELREHTFQWIYCWTFQPLVFRGVTWRNTHHTLCPGNNVRLGTKFIEHVDDHHTTGTKTTSGHKHSQSWDGWEAWQYCFQKLELFRLWTVFFFARIC